MGTAGVDITLKPVDAPVPYHASENAFLKQACKDGCALLDKLIDYQDGNDSDEEAPGRSPHYPQFLPLAHALIFLKSVKMGAFMAGVQHGAGFILARLPSGESPKSPETPGDGSCSSGSSSRVWSAPCFVRVEGVELGMVGGIQQVEMLVGMLSEKAFQEILHNRRVVLGAEWDVALWPLGSESGEMPLKGDVAVARVGRGFMMDVGLQGNVILIDHGRNSACYGPCATPEAILGGSLPPPPAMQPLSAKLKEATCCTLAACFEPAWHRHNSTSFD